MEIPLGLEKCFAFINSQLRSDGAGASSRPQAERKLAVTLSRQTGSGALSVAEKLADYLQIHAPGERVWTVFDRNLVQRVLEDHNLPRQLAQFMPEDRVSTIKDMMEESLGLHPAASTLVHETTETILKLAEVGNVIIVGRGAAVIASGLPHVFHVRLCGSLEKRVERIRLAMKLGKKAAQQFVETEERGRRRYLNKHFGADIEDPLLYHLTVNTDRFSLDDVAHLIGDAALRHRDGRVDAR